MKKHTIYSIFLIVFLNILSIHANLQFTIGPEFSHLTRVREGGTKQTGGLYGLKIEVDRLKYWGVYGGGEVELEEGTLNGHTGTNRRLKSKYSSILSEARLGFTFQKTDCRRIFIAPFFGGGYTIEKNHFRSPSPIPLHFKTKYPFLTLGFLSGIDIYPQFELGLLAKVRYPLSPKTLVTNDPGSDAVQQRMGAKLQCRIDLPITYRGLLQCERMKVGIRPYFEYRHYGKQINFPFDFFDTRIRIYGVMFEWQYTI